MLKNKKTKILLVITTAAILTSLFSFSASAKTISYQFNMSTSLPANNTGIVVKERNGAANVQVQNWTQTNSGTGYLEFMTQNEKYTTVSGRTVASHTGSYNVYYNSGEGKINSNYRLRGEYKLGAHKDANIQTSGYFTP
ncbi:MAG: hypothetical protein HFJ84_10945 [Clostridiales bacterium]|jgi:hypothetical protein|nr:hypothetical protein [Clostridiales bacterium]